MLTKLLCEFGATALMIIFGVGVHCDTVLKGTKYQGSGHMFAITTWSFGISVCLFVFGGAVCMNPAMVLAQCIVGLVPWGNCIPFMLADMLGGFVGAVIAWFMYADEFKASEGVVDPIAQRNIFSTNPTTEGTNYARNFFCEAICTFVFISAILAAASRAGENVLLLAICVGLIVWAVGMGMGGITGFAMNQARDLGPRMAYQVLPIKTRLTTTGSMACLFLASRRLSVPLWPRCLCMVSWACSSLRLHSCPLAAWGNFPARPRHAKRLAAHFVRRAFLRPAECAGKLPHAASCGVFAALEQAAQHINLNLDLDGRGLLLLRAVKRE